MHYSEQQALYEALVEDVKQQLNEVVEKMLGEAIKKGIIIVRQSDPVLVKEAHSDKVKLMYSAVIDYLGSEKIEQLERDLEYMKKLNGELHTAVSKFYEMGKQNTWLKDQM